MSVKADRAAYPGVGPVPGGSANDNREALEELFSRHRSQLYKTALRLLGK